MWPHFSSFTRVTMSLPFCVEIWWFHFTDKLKINKMDCLRRLTHTDLYNPDEVKKSLKMVENTLSSWFTKRWQPQAKEKIKFWVKFLDWKRKLQWTAFFEILAACSSGNNVWYYGAFPKHFFDELNYKIEDAWQFFLLIWKTMKKSSKTIQRITTTFWVYWNVMKDDTYLTWRSIEPFIKISNFWPS